MAHDIKQTDLLARLERQIIAFHTEQQKSLKDLQITMDYVKARLDEHTLINGPTSLSSLRANMPANTSIFYGRDFIVQELVTVLISPIRRHICILGPGGMGKTSTALAVMGDIDVKSHFSDGLRLWVPCIKATSVSLFLETLHTSLAIPKKSGNVLGDILAVLKASPPIVVLLDNFETPWNADEGQSEVEQVLRDIDQIPDVTLFVTMRSSFQPCGDISWHRVDLRAVDAVAARQIFCSWHPEGREDPDVPRLLESIGHMPLAVTLMAKFAGLTGLSADKLLEEYNSGMGTAMMGQGLDAKSSMDVCIGLSVYSPLMKAHLEAFDLLCTISMLPVGATYEMLSKCWAKDLMRALGVLKDTALIEQRRSSYFVLPVIQRYLLHPSRFPNHVRTSMVEAACTFLKEHASAIGDPLYKVHSAALSVEDGNLEAILLTAKVPDHHVIQDGLLLLARHQQYYRPRVDIIDRALTLVRTINHPILHGDVLHCYGEIFLQLHQYDKSLKMLEHALDLFLSVPDKKRAFECRLALDNVLRYHPDGTFELRHRIISGAKADCEYSDDEEGSGRRLLALGSLHRRYRHHSIALNMLSQAEQVFTHLRDRQRHAECSQALAWTYYDTSQYDLAYDNAMSALEENDSIGNLTKCSSVANDIGRILSARRDYQGSLRYFLRCLEIRKSMDLSPSGSALEGMGLAWAKLGRKADARNALEESLHYSSSEEPTLKSQTGIIRVEFFLKQLENPTLEPGAEELSALQGWYSVDHISALLCIRK
ncbi:hypothetical protein H0H87_010140 [Tephrocybe sp. NHM501043]|nr:hypothetical protein H0H87_010140 [Tephrocybe sp. NHM501043]